MNFLGSLGSGGNQPFSLQPQGPFSINPPKQHVKPQQGTATNFSQIMTPKQQHKKQEQSANIPAFNEKKKPSIHSNPLSTIPQEQPHKRSSIHRLEQREQKEITLNLPQASSVKKESAMMKMQSNHGKVTGLKNLHQGKYNKSYNPISPYDITNIYYQVCESPSDVQVETISKICDVFYSVMKKNKERSEDLEKYVIPEFNDVQEPFKTRIMQFWQALVRNFIQNLHPYCSQIAIVTLLKFHIKQNHETYYPNGRANLQIFKQTRILDGEYDESTSLWQKIQQSLNHMLCVFINQFCTIICKLPTQLCDRLLKEVAIKPAQPDQPKKLVDILWEFFTSIYNIDYYRDAHLKQSHVRNRISRDIIGLLVVLHHKSPALFTKQIVQKILHFLDGHLHIISKNLNISEPAVKDGDVSKSLGRQCIKLVNLLLFKFPYQKDKWEDKLQKCINDLKSTYLHPLKWAITDKRNQSRFMMQSQHNSTLLTTHYFHIMGSQWLLLLQTLIKMQDTFQHSLNQNLKQIIFYLLCSIIEQNPLQFWTDYEQYSQIYNYISSIYQKIVKNIDYNFPIQPELGKLCRVMVCACGRLSEIHDQDVDSTYVQVMGLLKKQSVVLRAGEHLHDPSVVLTNLVYQNFASAIIGIKGVNRHKLFAELFINYMISVQDEEIYKYNSEDPAVARYSYENPNIIIYELLVRIMIDNPSLCVVLSKMWKVQQDKLNPSKLPEQDTQKILQQFLFTFLITIPTSILQANKGEPYQNLSYTYTSYSNSSPSSPPVFNPISISFQLMNKMLCSEYKQSVLTLLFSEEKVLKNTRLRDVLQIAVFNQQSVRAFVRHAEILYENGLQTCLWYVQILKPIITSCISNWQQIIIRHYAKITKISLTKVLSQQQKNNPSSPYLQLSPIQLLSPSQSASSQQLKKIPQLLTYQKQITQFILWCLKIEQHYFNPQYFYNTLYKSGKFQSLSAALQLLQVLIVLFVKMRDRVYFPDRLRRFLGDFGVAVGSGSKGLSFGIMLANKKVATLASALVYLTSSPMLQKSQGMAIQPAKARQSRTLALNILSLLLITNCSPIYWTSAIRGNDNEQIDPLSNIDFNIYQQFFVSEYQKVYANSKQILVQYLDMQIKQNLHGVSMTPLAWYQYSYNYGQYIDTIIYISKLFKSTSIQESISRRINEEYENGNKIDQQVCKVMNKIDQIKGYSQLSSVVLPHYISDRQTLAYSRYLLQWCITHKKSQQLPSPSSLFNKLLQLILTKLLAVILECPSTPQSRIKQSIIVPVSQNLWKCLRILQAKSLPFFVSLLEKCMPFVLNYYHVTVNDAAYLAQYVIGIRLVLACREYLPDVLMRKIEGIEKINEMVFRLIQEAVVRPGFQVVLFYSLLFYKHLMKNKNNQLYHQQLRQIESTLNSTLILTLTQPQAFSSNLPIFSNITISSLIMFFSEQLPSPSPPSQSSIHSILLSHRAEQQKQYQSFNTISLLYNIEQQISKANIQNALHIAWNSHHYLEFVSVCHYLYRVLGNVQGNIQETDFGRIQGGVQILFTFIDKIIDLQPSFDATRYEQSWRKCAFMKSWACNLLYLIIGKGSRQLLVRISAMLLNKGNLLSLLGQLLTLYGEYPIKWPYSGTKVIKFIRLGLLEKELLNSILKVYSALIARRQDWFEKSGFGTTDSSKNTAFYNLCRSFVYASKILSRHLNSSISIQQRYTVYQTMTANTCQSEYQQTLQKYRIESLYSPYLIALSQRSSRSQSTPDTKIEQGKIQLLHPESTYCLDLIHDHFNALITQKYMMILMGCYANPDLILDSYEFHQVFNVLENVAKRLSNIQDAKQVYNDVMRDVDLKIWRNYRMSVNLYFLNRIQDSPEEQHSLLNSICECSVHCLINLKAVLEMHQDHRQFMSRADKTFKQIRRVERVFNFDIKQSLEQGGFQNKSQYGTSYMMSPSAARFT